MQNKDYFLACYSLPPAQLKNRRQTVDKPRDIFWHTFFAVEEAWNLASQSVYEQPDHASIERKWILHKKTLFRKKDAATNARFKNLPLNHWVIYCFFVLCCLLFLSSSLFVAPWSSVKCSHERPGRVAFDASWSRRA